MINIESSTTNNENDVFLEGNDSSLEVKIATNAVNTTSMDLLNPENISSTKASESNTISDENKLSTNQNASFLCIKVNKNKDFINCPLNRKMKNRIESEFWFQINDAG